MQRCETTEAKPLLVIYVAFVRPVLELFSKNHAAKFHNPSQQDQYVAIVWNSNNMNFKHEYLEAINAVTFNTVPQQFIISLCIGKCYIRVKRETERERKGGSCLLKRLITLDLELGLSLVLRFHTAKSAEQLCDPTSTCVSPRKVSS